MVNKILYFLPTVLLLTLFFARFSITNDSREYLVIRAVDGDTIDLEGGERVRLLGIDAPEIDQPLYQEASVALKEMVEGRKVRLEKEHEWNKDKYGRLLRYVFVEERFVNLEMVREGLAQLTAENDSKYYSILKQAEQEAIEKRLGIWSVS